MLIISVTDNENNRRNRNAKKNKTKTKTNKDRKKQGDGSFSERVRAKWLWCAFKFSPVKGFHQLICKASLIFKSNLEFVNYFKRKRIIQELSFLICSSILVLKMSTSFANIARDAASIFINLPNLPNKIASVFTFWLHASYWNVIKFYLKEDDCFQCFSIRLSYYLCFAFHCVFTV